MVAAHSSPDALFRALSAAPRRRILTVLGPGPMTAGDIARAVGMTQSAVSKHLALLEAAGLVWRRRQGQFRRYGLEGATLTGGLARFAQDVCCTG